MKAAVDHYGTDPEGIALFAAALRKGLKAEPPHSAPYVKIVIDRVLGPLSKTPQGDGPGLFILLNQQLGTYDPLARPEAEAPPPILVQGKERARAALTAPAPPPVKREPGMEDFERA